MSERSLRRTAVSVAARATAGVARAIGQVRPGWIAETAGTVARAIARRWQARPGARRRRLRRRAAIPLPSLYALYPQARLATPREIGLRSIDVDEIAGTAVGGATQRGSDFKPLPAFRSQNWEGRWQRIRRAVDRLAILPPIDVVRYVPAGKYWVLDGHNRVAAAYDVGQVSIDANVTELVPPGQNPTERPGDLAAALIGTRSLRAAGQGGPLQTVDDDVVLGVPGREDGPAPEEPAPETEGAATEPPESPSTP